MAVMINNDTDPGDEQLTFLEKFRQHGLTFTQMDLFPGLSRVVMANGSIYYMRSGSPIDDELDGSKPGAGIVMFKESDVIEQKN
jgi:hypothetical protein